jgi:3-oxoacyl-[acyl-carrier protein] reductase
LSYGVQAEIFKCDIGDEEQVKGMIDSIIVQFGRLDAVVNNAGVVFDKGFDDRTVEDFEKTFRVNVIGTFLVSKYAAPHLKETKGNIVIASSTSGVDNFNTTSIDYDCSKAALIAMIKDLAKEFAPDVRVNGTVLGWADTDMNKELPESYLEEEREKILLGRFARLEEVAKLYYYLATVESSYINGQVVQIDGGTF